MTLAFLSAANCRALGLTGNQLTKAAWPLGLSPDFYVRKLTKNSTCIIGFFWLKYLAHLENLGEKNTLRIKFFVSYVKQKINLRWPY